MRGEDQLGVGQHRERRSLGFICLPSGRPRAGLPVRSTTWSSRRITTIACGVRNATFTIGGEARADTPPLFVHPPALRLSRSHPVRRGGRGGVTHGAGGCGPAFPLSSAVIGLVTLVRWSGRKAGGLGAEHPQHLFPEAELSTRQFGWDECRTPDPTRPVSFR